jgi:hypothetical protein
MVYYVRTIITALFVTQHGGVLLILVLPKQVVIVNPIGLYSHGLSCVLLCFTWGGEPGYTGGIESFTVFRFWC